MITSIEQCVEIQKRRVASGKRGYSKAVRRFVRTLATAQGAVKTYGQIMGDLPVDWEKKKDNDGE